MKNQLKLFTLVLLACSALSTCNTFHGFGEDVSHLGGAISRAAKIVPADNLFSVCFSTFSHKQSMLKALYLTATIKRTLPC